MRRIDFASACLSAIVGGVVVLEALPLGAMPIRMPTPMASTKVPTNCGVAEPLK